MSAHADNAIGPALHQRKVTVQEAREILHDFRRVCRQNVHHQIRDIQAGIVKVKAEDRRSGNPHSFLGSSADYLHFVVHTPGL